MKKAGSLFLALCFVFFLAGCAKPPEVQKRVFITDTRRDDFSRCVTARLKKALPALQLSAFVAAPSGSDFTASGPAAGTTAWVVLRSEVDSAAPYIAEAARRKVPLLLIGGLAPSPSEMESNPTCWYIGTHPALLAEQAAAVLAEVAKKGSFDDRNKNYMLDAVVLNSAPSQEAGTLAVTALQKTISQMGLLVNILSSYAPADLTEARAAELQAGPDAAAEAVLCSDADGALFALQAYSGTKEKRPLPIIVSARYGPSLYDSIAAGNIRAAGMEDPAETAAAAAIFLNNIAKGYPVAQSSALRLTEDRRVLLMGKAITKENIEEAQTAYNCPDN